MKLCGMMLVDSADVGQTLSVQGANWDGLSTSAVPAGHELVVVLLLRPEPDDVGAPQPVELHVNHAESRAMAGHAHVDLGITHWTEQTAVALTVSCVFPDPGRYVLAFDSAFGSDQLGFDLLLEPSP